MLHPTVSWGALPKASGEDGFEEEGNKAKKPYEFNSTVLAAWEEPCQSEDPMIWPLLMGTDEIN